MARLVTLPRPAPDAYFLLIVVSLALPGIRVLPTPGALGRFPSPAVGLECVLWGFFDTFFSLLMPFWVLLQGLAVAEGRTVGSTTPAELFAQFLLGAGGLINVALFVYLCYPKARSFTAKSVPLLTVLLWIGMFFSAEIRPDIGHFVWIAGALLIVAPDLKLSHVFRRSSQDFPLV